MRHNLHYLDMGNIHFLKFFFSTSLGHYTIYCLKKNNNKLRTELDYPIKNWGIAANLSNSN